jgi:hypothetical protein
MKMKNLLFVALATLGINANTMAQSLPNYVPFNGLIGWWPFNGNANDESINNNNGIVNGALLTEDRFGEADHAYNFNGIDNFIDLGNSNSLNSIDTNFTISVWINDFSILDNSTIIACHATGFQWRYLLRTLSDSINGQFVRNDNNNWTFNYTESNSILENTWTNIIMLKNDSNFQIFINGSLQSTSIVPSTTVGGNNNNAYTKIGVNWPSTPDLEYFKGNIDDLGIWNRALTQQEITDLYNANICYQTITVTDTLLINMGIVTYNPITYNNTIKIFPNPANNHITIDYGNFATLNGYQLKIENSLGQQLFQTNITQQTDYLSLNNWGGNGLYFVHIIDAQGNTIDIRKIVLQ